MQRGHPSAQVLPTALRAVPPAASTPIFVLALLAASLAHVAAILALSFAPPVVPPAPQQALEILILKERGYSAATPPADAALSQHDRVGESPSGNAILSANSDAALASEPAPPAPQPADREAAPLAESPPPPALKPLPAPPLPSPPPADAAVLSARLNFDTEPLPLPALADPTPPAAPPVDAAQILATQGSEIARLTESLEARSAEYARRVRRKSVSASTREFRYASYLSAWAHKIERVGNLNYPQAAKEQRLYGSLILHVAVRADGSVEQIRVVRSSGHELLDAAAIRIVELAAPYSPFPPDIAEDTDVLDIVRTWQFMRGDVLGWER